MNSKLNRDEFLKLKDEILEIEVNTMEDLEKRFLLQEKLLSYDLSDVSFDDWIGFDIIADENHIADFSKSNANIDFSNIIGFNYCNFKNCNIKNLDMYSDPLNRNNFDDKTINKNSNLFFSEDFSNDFIKKNNNYDLTISDITLLSNDELLELKNKNIKLYFTSYDYNNSFYQLLGINKIIDLYLNSPGEFLDIFEMFGKIMGGKEPFIATYDLYSNTSSITSFSNNIANSDASEIKNICFSYIKNNIINRNDIDIDIDELPSLFVKENRDILLLDRDVPDELREKYYTKSLSISNIVDNIEVFEKLPIYSIINDKSLESFGSKIGFDNLIKIIKLHPDTIKYLIETKKFNSFNMLLNEVTSNDIESYFTHAIKEYIYSYNIINSFESYIDRENNRLCYKVPEWLSSFNFSCIDSIESIEDFINVDSSTIIMSSSQRDFIDLFGLENIKKIEDEIGFFSHKSDMYSKELELFNAAAYSTKLNYELLLKKAEKYNSSYLSYDNACDLFAFLLNKMREDHVFYQKVPNYDWIKGDFREKYSHIFIDENAPNGLKAAFYNNTITPLYLYKNPQFLPYLENMDLSNTIFSNIKLGNINSNNFSDYIDFVPEYVSRYGNRSFLNLIKIYGFAMNDMVIVNLYNEIDDKDEIEKSFRASIFGNIMDSKMNYISLINDSKFVSEYPSIFVDFSDILGISIDEITRLEDSFYSRKMTPDDIKLYPQLVNILKDKDLKIAFGNSQNCLRFINYFDELTFLNIAKKYGRYIDAVPIQMNLNWKFDDVSYFEDICEILEDIICKECSLGNFNYYPVDSPDFLKKRHPEIFLDSDAPIKLKECFYSEGTSKFNFNVLAKHKEWLPFLKNKSMVTSLVRSCPPNEINSLSKYFSLFGYDAAIKLGIKRPDTVYEMINYNEIELMKQWYEKTGCKFVPDSEVMRNFDIKEADKFLTSGSNWSKLMKINNFSETPSNRTALIKLAYCFGTFDHDIKGFNKLIDLLNRIPIKLNSKAFTLVNAIDLLLSEDLISSKKNDPNVFLKLYEVLCDEEIDISPLALVNLINSIKEENINIDYSRNIFSQLYRKNNDESYTLTISQQSYPKTCEAIQNILFEYYGTNSNNFSSYFPTIGRADFKVNNDNIPLFTPEIAACFIKDFDMIYDPDFRDFFLRNLDKILLNREYLQNISLIQNKFNEIKKIYHNIPITIELVNSYVQENKFKNVEIGNENVAKTAAILDYTQEEFEQIQKIYNYAKMRVFSSIPRIENKNGLYTYEILRLDDTLALSIGKLTDCCQRLGEPGEMCMEHSMISNSGRVFVVRDNLGHIVAQSWVWRNKNVLCFDNIEVPDKQMIEHGIPKSKVDSGIRNQFTDEVLEVYKKAANELIQVDNKKYTELLNKGLISKDEYEGLKLSKITVGLGYSNIKGSFETLTIDNNISRPYSFIPPVELSRGLYINDSEKQYILDTNDYDNKLHDKHAINLYNDEYILYDDSNFKKVNLLTLNKLELVTKESDDFKTTNVSDNDYIVSQIANIYGLNPINSRIICHPNFAIIFEKNDSEIIIADLLFNTSTMAGDRVIDIKDEVLQQMKLAFHQISDELDFNISMLNDKQKIMYYKVMNLNEELFMNRGDSFAK